MTPRAIALLTSATAGCFAWYALKDGLRPGPLRGIARATGLVAAFAPLTHDTLTRSQDGEITASAAIGVIWADPGSRVGLLATGAGLLAVMGGLTWLNMAIERRAITFLDNRDIPAATTLWGALSAAALGLAMAGDLT